MTNEVKRIKQLIEGNDAYMFKALVTLYQFQTEDEQSMETTNHTNGAGFNYMDAGILTSFAKFYQERNYLTDRQKEVARKMLKKYAGQLNGVLSTEGYEVMEETSKTVTKKEEVIIKVRIEVKESNRCNGEYSLYITSDYDKDLVSEIRGYQQRWYYADTRMWETPSTNLDDLLNFLKSNKKYQYEVIGSDVLNQKKEVTNIPEEYEFTTKPFNHQLDAISYGLNHDRWLLGDSMGLGKTKVVIDIACIKKQLNGYKHCLIICGVNGLKWNWVNEIKVHSKESSYILGTLSNGRIGTTENKLNDIINLSNIEEYFIITNIETLRNEECVAELKKQCSKGEIEMIALDEAHTCKNPTSQQGKGMLKLSAKTMIAMTGTPLMNNPIDLYFVLKWLGYEKHSLYAFRNYYCEMGGYGGYQIVGYKNLNQLKDQLDSLMLRRLKEDVFDLPEKVYVDEYVELLPKQKLIYDEVKQLIKSNIDKIVVAPNPLTELIRMRQATGYPGILSSEIEDSAKIDRLEELVDEAISNNQKVVIFSNWTQMTNPIMKRLSKKYYCVMITGEITTEARQKAMEEFQTNDKCKVVIGTTSAMGTGITLTAGTVEIFMDEPWNKALKEQAVDRCHRIGTKSNVTIYTLMAKNTIDERIHDLVEEKGMMSDALVDGKIVGDRKELLDYLLS